MKLVRYPQFYLFFILIAATLLRLINLGAEPFWGDEALSIDIVHHFQSVSDMVSYLSWVEVHPPGYYVLLHYWTALFGFAEFGVRLLSVVAGILSIIMMYAIAKRMFAHERIALYAAGILALLPLHIEFSAEARPYALVLLCGLCALWAYGAYCQTKEVRYAAAYAIAATAGLYMHYSFFLVMATFSFVWFVWCVTQHAKKRNHELFVWFCAHGSIGIAFSFWLTPFLYKYLLGQYAIFGAERVTGTALRRADFFASSYMQLIWTAKELFSDYIQVANKIEIIAVFIAQLSLVGALGYMLVKHAERVRACMRTYAHALWTLCALLIIPVVLYAYLPISIPYGGIAERHIIFVCAIIALCVALVLSALPLRARIALSAVLFASIMNFSIVIIGNDETWDYHHRLKNMADMVNGAYREGDMVLVNVALVRTDLNHFLRPDIEAIGVYPLLYTGNDLFASRETLGIIENESQLRASNATEHDQTEAIGIKMRYLTATHKPKRMWLILLTDSSLVHNWLRNNGYTRAIAPIGALLPVELYRKDT